MILYFLYNILIKNCIEENVWRRLALSRKIVNNKFALGRRTTEYGIALLQIQSFLSCTIDSIRPHKIRFRRWSVYSIITTGKNRGISFAICVHLFTPLSQHSRNVSRWRIMQTNFITVPQNKMCFNERNETPNLKTVLHNSSTALLCRLLFVSEMCK